MAEELMMTQAEQNAVLAMREKGIDPETIGAEAEVAGDRILTKAEVEKLADDKVDKKLAAADARREEQGRVAASKAELQGAVRREIDTDKIYKDVPEFKKSQIEARAVQLVVEAPDSNKLQGAELTKALAKATRDAIKEERDIAGGAPTGSAEEAKRRLDSMDEPGGEAPDTRFTPARSGIPQDDIVYGATDKPYPTELEILSGQAEEAEAFLKNAKRDE